MRFTGRKEELVDDPLRENIGMLYELFKVAEKYHDKWDDAIDSIDFKNIDFKQALNFKGVKNNQTAGEVEPDNTMV